MVVDCWLRIQDLHPIERSIRIKHQESARDRDDRLRLRCVSSDVYKPGSSYCGGIAKNREIITSRRTARGVVGIGSRSFKDLDLDVVKRPASVRKAKRGDTAGIRNRRTKGLDLRAVNANTVSSGTNSTDDDHVNGCVPIAAQRAFSTAQNRYRFLCVSGDVHKTGSSYRSVIAEYGDIVTGTGPFLDLNIVPLRKWLRKDLIRSVGADLERITVGVKASVELNIRVSDDVEGIHVLRHGGGDACCQSSHA